MTINLKNLLNPKGKMSKMGEFQELKSIDGLKISAVSADLYGDGRDDLTLFFLMKAQTLELYIQIQKLHRIQLIGI